MSQPNDRAHSKIRVRRRDSAKVEKAGYAKFNNCPHLCVDIPDGHSTITCRTVDGRRITFAFCPYHDRGPPQCVDVQAHQGQEIRRDEDVFYAQRLIGFRLGGGDTFRTDTAEVPTVLATVLID
jgi:hypothetical protein